MSLNCSSDIHVRNYLGGGGGGGEGGGGDGGGGLKKGAQEHKDNIRQHKPAKIPGWTPIPLAMGGLARISAASRQSCTHCQSCTEAREDKGKATGGRYPKERQKNCDSYILTGFTLGEEEKEGVVMEGAGLVGGCTWAQGARSEMTAMQDTVQTNKRYMCRDSLLCCAVIVSIHLGPSCRLDNSNNGKLCCRNTSGEEGSEEEG